MGKLRSCTVALVVLTPLVLGTAASRWEAPPLLASAQGEEATTGPLEASPTVKLATE